MKILFAVVLLDMIGFGIVIPVLPFIVPSVNGDKMDIAMIIATFALFAAICGPLWGRLSDRVGRKPVIIVCLLGAAVAYLVLGSAQTLGAIYGARALAGLMAGNFGVALAMMADLTRPDQRARGMGMIGAAFGLGFVLGPVVGGLLSGDSGSFLVPCLFAAGMSVCAAVAALVTLRESMPPALRREMRDARNAQGRVSMPALLKATRSRLLLLQYVIHTASVSGATYLFPVWSADLLHWGAREVGVVFGAVGAMMAISQGGLLGPLVRNFGELILLRCCTGLFLSGLVMAVFAGGSAWSMVGSILVALSGATLCMPLLNTLTSHRVPPEHRGRMLGTTSSAAAIGRVIGPVLAGVVLALTDYPWVWALYALLVSGYFLWAMTLRSPQAQMQADS